jgi:hypothetical protein
MIFESAASLPGPASITVKQTDHEETFVISQKSNDDST